jgi:hypothetical protein
MALAPRPPPPGSGTQSDFQQVKGISLQMIGTSGYGYELTWSAGGLPSGLTIDPYSGLIRTVPQ